MRPIDALFNREALVRLSRQFTDAYPDGRRDEDGAIDLPTLFSYETQELEDAPLYYVTRDMTALAVQASKSLPSEPLLATDPPTPYGFCVWDAPIGQIEDGESDSVPIHGVFWRFSEGHYHEDDDPEGELTIYRSYEIYFLGAWRRMLIPFANATWDIDDPGRPEGDWEPSHHLFNYVAQEPSGFDVAPETFQAVRSTWTLMGQTLAATSEYRDRAADRRADRAGRPPSPIVVVMLRRLHRRSGDADGDGVDWSHQWLVSGHWRNQWLPSVNAHRLQWINPHVKGPDGAPLVLKDRVTVLGR